jgi:hypothetical protein
MTGQEYSSDHALPINSSIIDSSGFVTSAEPSANSRDVTQGDELVINLEYGSPMICAICEGPAQQTVQKSGVIPLYFAVYNAYSKAWSMPPGGDGCLVHRSKGHACDDHLKQMQKLQNDWAANPYSIRTDGTFLYCFADYKAHEEFAIGRGEYPVGG